MERLLGLPGLPGLPGLLVLAAPGHPPPDMIGFDTSNPHATDQIAPDGV